MLTGLPLLNKLWQTREEQQAPVRAFCEALEEAKRSAVEHVASAVLAGELENLEGEQAKLTQRYLDWSALWRRYTDEVGGRVGGGDDLLQQHNQRLGALRGDGEQQSATLKEQIERGRALESASSINRPFKQYGVLLPTLPWFHFSVRNSKGLTCLFRLA